jgi:hypothetical protein
VKRDGTEVPGYQKLLRWYPRAWRERYGEEFLAMIEDTLDGQHLTLRLRISVAWGGLRERARSRTRILGRTAAAPLRAAFGAGIDRRWAFFLSGWLLAGLPAQFGVSVPAATTGRAAAALDAEAAVGALAAAVVLARCVIALPAFGRFVRAGGWRKVRRQVAWAAGATAVAAGALAGLVLASAPVTFAQWNQSLTFALGALMTALLITAAIGLWARMAATTSGQLDIPRGAWTGERVLSVVAVMAVLLMMSCCILWLAAVQSSVPLLIFALISTSLQGVNQTVQMRGAIRPGRHRRSAAGRAR